MSKKICPLPSTSRATSFYLCHKNCAWYVEDMCAITFIAKMEAKVLKEVEREVKRFDSSFDFKMKEKKK